jgi:hypothetical protein
VALPAGRRKLQRDGRTYEWLVRRREETLHVVLQDAAARGQLLVADFPAVGLCDPLDSDGCYWAHSQVTPALVSDLIGEALGRGWRPQAKGLRPFHLHPAPPTIQQGLAASHYAAHLTEQDVLDLWEVLRTLYRDPHWRQRLLECPWQQVFAVPNEVVGRGDPGRVARVAVLGGLVAFRRQCKPKDGDTDPCFAVRAAGTWLEVLMNVSHLYRPFEAGGP